MKIWASGRLKIYSTIGRDWMVTHIMKMLVSQKEMLQDGNLKKILLDAHASL